MLIEVEKIKVNYSIFGNHNKKVVLFLHGWGCDSSIFYEIVKDLENFYKCILVDFPPFGQSSKPNKILTLNHYALFINEILKKESIKNYSVICHSFGARVALLLKFDGALIITGGAGLKPKRNAKYYFKIWKYKLFKKFLKQEKQGSKDYQKLSGKMKKTFVNIVSTFQEKDAKLIKNPTLLIYGDKDKETPIYMAKKFYKLIQNSTLKIYKGASHFAFLEKKELFFSDVFDFLKKNV